ncbi:MAG: 8-oxo-dGTP diphosphatase [Akkermansiaceae bacterium]|nr:8-oxo-dGTP diphosphatase [Akkermansiaceae bacterium]NNM30191.1 8-oxo-dGTP diphosphatase [Akkermansiaceae bacterium]
MSKNGTSSPIDWANWQAEIHATLMFVVNGYEVLLIEKQRGIGAGKINGPGGKIDPGETPLESAVRETQEELLITPRDPRKMGELFFAMSDMPDIHCHVYTSHSFVGTPTETPEAVPRWTRFDKIPYELMWEDDQHWLPHMLEDERTFIGRFKFEGERISWMDVQFDIEM